MTKRITTIIGAGAVLDFDYTYSNAVKPSSKNILNEIKDLKVQGYDKEFSDVISKVYNLANNTFNKIYKNRGLLQEHYELNFEYLYFLLESMLNFSSDIKYLDPHSFPPLYTILNVKDELKDYFHIEYARALHAIVKKITKIIDTYDVHFRSDPYAESWYKSFWKERDNIKFDIFTFNYDTTIEYSIGNYEDGYRPIPNNSLGISFFDPKALLNNTRKLSTVNHLHGCIYYSECAPIECKQTHSNRDMFKMRTVDDAMSQLGVQSKNQTQAQEMFLNSPILIGLRKLDKMTNLPSSIYHSHLINKLFRNKGLLIIGYSFGDLYVNQLIQRRLLMKGEKHRLVIIEYFPSYVNSTTSFFRHLTDNCRGLKAFLDPLMDMRFCNFNLVNVTFKSYDEPIYSNDKKIMIFICGFKRAVELHKDLIYNFL